MYIARMARITLINLRHSFLVHFAAAVVIAMLTPLVFSISALDRISSARPIEMLLCMTGTVLLTPVFSPEQNENIRDVIRSKKVGYLWVCFIRAVYSVIALAAIIGAYVLVMKLCECDVTAAHFGAGFASAFFMGAVGLAFAKLAGNPIAGYMASMIYYLLNFIGSRLGCFWMFTMSNGKTDVNYALIIWGTVIIAGTFIISAITEKSDL